MTATAPSNTAANAIAFDMAERTGERVYVSQIRKSCLEHGPLYEASTEKPESFLYSVGVSR